MQHNEQQKIGKHKDTASLIYSTLRNEILNLTIKPGEEISEGVVCDRFGASRTPVREAYQRLQSAGLITTVPYKGSFASLLDYNEIQQVIFMRGIVEAAVISDFIQNITAYQLEELRYKINIQKVLITDDFDSIRFQKADANFHSTWFKHQNKMLLWKIIQKSQLQYSRFRMLDLHDQQHCKKIYDDHTLLFTFIEKNKSKDAEVLIKKHLESGVNRIASKIPKEYASYFK